MKKLLILISILFFVSCDPKNNCTEPRCNNSNVYPDSSIIATLSGNMDSIINIGDTFKISMKIPDTLKTNYGSLYIKQVLPSSYFFISYYGEPFYFDSLEVSDYNLELKVIKGHGPQSGQNIQQMSWDLIDKEYQAYFIPTKKGKYIIQLKQSRTEIKTTDNKEWLINLNIEFQKGRPFRIEQYRNFFITDDFRNDVSVSKQSEIKDYWYWFEVE